MSDNVFNYQGYQGSIEASIEDGVLYGSILHIVDKVTYEAETLKNLKEEFELAVDYYLNLCKEKEIIPDKPFSGTFNVRIGMELHKKATFHSRHTGVSLNELIKCSITEYLNRHEGVHEIHHHHHYELSGAFEIHSAGQNPPRPKPQLKVVQG